MSPRPFERPATIRLPDAPALPPGAALDGLWLPPRGGEPRGGALVAPPHPLMGGSMSSPVVTEVALAASDAGRAALRFDWRGVGASAGRPSGEAADADADTLAALDFLRESVEGPLVACGYSWGALAAYRVGLEAPRVRRLVLVAPPPALLERERLARAGRPVLIVAGDRDDYVPLAALRERVDGITGVTLVVLPGVDHFFAMGIGELGRNVREWLGGGAASDDPRR